MPAHVYVCVCVCICVCVRVKCSFKVLVGGLRVKPEKDMGRKEGSSFRKKEREERERNGGKEIERLPCTFLCELTGLDA